MLNEIRERNRAAGLKPRLGTAIDPARPFRLGWPFVQSVRLVHTHFPVLEWASVEKGPALNYVKTPYSLVHDYQHTSYILPPYSR